jgi:hypothetical protein
VGCFDGLLRIEHDADDFIRAAPPLFKENCAVRSLRAQLCKMR